MTLSQIQTAIEIALISLAVALSVYACYRLSVPREVKAARREGVVARHNLETLNKYTDEIQAQQRVLLRLAQACGSSKVRNLQLTKEIVRYRMLLADARIDAMTSQVASEVRLKSMLLDAIDQNRALSVNQREALKGEVKKLKPPTRKGT